VADARLLAAGDQFFATRFRHHVTVLRVAKDQAWADIRVVDPTVDPVASWTKRQPLREGLFMFEVEYLGSAR